MEDSSLKQYQMPLHLQLAMRKAELASEEMTWDQMRIALLNLYSRRLLEIQAVRDILTNEGVEVEFNIPSDIELQELAIAKFMMEVDPDELKNELEDDEEPPTVFS
tara:strand:- start:17420 stop:17737 length:318 start_codon:yes stop_codon:yes gene_type:complete